MKLPRIIHLLDDFNLGGVSRSLSIFETEALREVVSSSVVAVRPEARTAPRLEADLIALHFPPNWRRLLFAASLRLRNPRARLIWVEHSYTGAWEALKVPHKGRFHAMLRLAYGMAHKVVCVSEGQAAWLRGAVGLDAHKVEVIHPYADNPGLSLLDVPDFAAKPLRIGAYGRFCEQKGLDVLIRAHRRGLMPGTELIIGGFGEDEAALIAAAEGSEAIHFYGRVAHVADFLRECDMVAVPSRWEAYGMVATEAREAGRPILVADVDGLPEQVGQAGLVVDFARSESVLAAMRELTPARLADMAEAARKSTIGCGEGRQWRWARLLSVLAHGEAAASSAAPAAVAALRAAVP